ncbi:hypothetical protein F7725_016506, partial [Dissostichus mawsoni]
RRLSLQPWDSEEGEKRRREGGSERQRGRVRKRESEEEGSQRGRVRRENTMASDLGLVVILLWTISLQAVGSTGTNSNEVGCH